MSAGAGVVVCVDVGSTYTKAALVELGSGRLVGTASHPTTIATDVMEAYDACVADLGVGPGVPALACSSAGGGLRLAVVGYEREITAEAGFRVGLSAGARVVQVSAGRLGPSGLAALLESNPDVILLAGGTDGGNAEVLLSNASVLADAPGLVVPVVVAGNVQACAQVVERLVSGGKTALATANVLPSIGRLEPRPARETIREVFIRHVIGGKGLSARPEFLAMVRAATPDSVLTGVELLADGAGEVVGRGDVLVVDVGGATTDVYSVVTPHGEDAVLRKEVVEVMWRSRTVEGDLGVRWNAPGIVEAAAGERLVSPAAAAVLRAAALRRHEDPSFVPVDDAERDLDARLAELAVTVALRRHGRGGKNLRDVALVIGSGGVLRHADPARRSRILSPATRDFAGGWPVPERARVMVDSDYVLAAAGLLAAEHPETAARLLAVLAP